MHVPSDPYFRCYFYLWQTFLHLRLKTFDFFLKSQLQYLLGQVKFPVFSNTAPLNLQMVSLVRVNPNKIDLEASNQILFGLRTFLGGTTTV